MDELTVREIAEKLGINPGAAKIRLQRQGIKPIKIVGQTAVYDPAVVEAIRNVPGKGRPPKKPPEPGAGA
jgi:predicted ArsR family transcriptional regulator